MTGRGDVTHLAPGDHVDLDAVEWSRTALAGNGHAAVLDLGRVRSWDRDALPAMAALLDAAPGSVRVVGPPAASFLDVLDAADVRGIWPVFDDVRRLRRAAARLRGAAGRPALRTAVPGSRASRRRDLRTLTADRTLFHPRGDAGPREEEP